MLFAEHSNPANKHKSNRVLESSKKLKYLLLNKWKQMINHLSVGP